MKLVFFSTAHCSLCEQGLDLLFSMPELRGMRLEVVDVAEAPGLVERYGPRLPVFAIGSEELDWPFDAATVAAALARGANL